MQIAVLNKQTSHLWNTQLPQIGVRIRSIPSENEPSETRNSPKNEQQIDHPINTVHLRQFASVPGEKKTYTDIPIPQDIHLDKLLHALHQVGENFNQENALRLHADTQSWVKTITQKMDLPEDIHYGLSLKGSFGEIELDLEDLAPEKIQHFFTHTLAGFNAEELRLQHTQLGDHSHISAGFSTIAEVSEADQKAQELILLADALMQKLELAPTPDSPDILNLLRKFLEILRQLDIDLGALQKNEQAQAIQAKKTSDHFSQQLQSRLLRIQALAINSKQAEWDALKVLNLK